jgi:fatty acid synthase
MAVFLRNITFHGILLDALFDGAASDHDGEWGQVAALVARGIEEGAVTPLQHTTFPADDVEGAFRFMAQGKHIGKVLIQVRNGSRTDEEEIQ